MNPCRHLAALVAAATPLAFAQAGPPTDRSAAPTPVGPTLSEQAMFSITTGTRSPDTEAAHAIVKALAADASLKGSKITVQPEDNKILLTGVTPTLAQHNRASEIAAQHAGDSQVVNVTVTEEVFLESHPTGLGELEQVNVEGPPA